MAGWCCSPFKNTWKCYRVEMQGDHLDSLVHVAVNLRTWGIMLHMVFIKCPGNC